MERKKVLDIAGFDIVDDRMFFILRCVNGLFQMDMHTGGVEYLVSSDKDKLEAGGLYSDIKIDGEKIWCIPYSADHILIYHLTEKICEYIEIPKLKGRGRSGVKFNTAYDYGDQFILIPAEYPAILKINKQTYKMDLIQWEEKFLQANPDYFERNSRLHIARDFERIGSMLYLLAYNVIVKYNMDSDNLSFVRVDNEGSLYTGIVRQRKQFALVDRMHSEIVLWDSEENSVAVTGVDLGYRGLKAEDDGCPLGLCKVGEGFVVVQRNADFLVLLDEKMEARKIKLNRQTTSTFSDCYKQVDDKLILTIDGENQVLLINTGDWSQSCVEMDLDHFDFAWFNSMIGATNDYLEENPVYYDLTDLIDRIEKYEKESEINDSCQIGKNIYQAL